MGAENAAVLADAQFGIVRLLRPFTDFETDYQGVAATIPIMMTEKSRPLDKLAAAGETGYAPDLVRGLEVPMGARLVIWLPTIRITADAIIPYIWSFWWRFRNVGDNRKTQQPFHYPKQGPGVPDTGAPAGEQARVVIPASNQTIIYTQTEPATALTRVTQNLRSEDLNVGSLPIPLPLIPGGATGALQQGLLNPAGGAVADQPLYQVHEISAVGDELLLGVTRNVDEDANWGFADGEPDAQFSDFLGTGLTPTKPDIGVYVSTGAAP
jgi:hypothetical protein